MKNKQWLISWIGYADHDASEKGEAVGLGPIATALQAGLQFHRVCLLTNLSHERGAKFCEWLEEKFGLSSNVLDLQKMDLVSPIHYASGIPPNQ